MQITDFEPVRVNGVAIDEAILAKEIQFYPAASLAEAREQAAKELVLKELLKQTAKARGLGENDEAIDALLASDIVVNQPSDEECRAYFEAHAAAFVSEPLYAASHLLLAADISELEKREQLIQKANDLIEQIKQNPTLFEGLVTLFSDCPSKEQGGQLGQFTKGTMVPEFEAAVAATPSGLVAEPVETEFGIHIIRVDHHDTGRVLPYEYVQQQVADKLMMLDWHRRVNQYLRQLVAQANIEGVILS